MSEPGQVFAALGEVADLLQSAAVAHYRRRSVESGPGGCDERSAEVPKDISAIRLRTESKVR